MRKEKGEVRMYRVLQEIAEREISRQEQQG